MSKHDQAVDKELEQILEPGETVLGRAFTWTGPGVMLQMLLLGGLLSLFFTTYYFVVITDRRIVSMRVKSGLTGIRIVAAKTESFGPERLVSARTAGMGNQRRLILELREGETRTLRLNTLARQISGQKEFISVAEAQIPHLALAA